jgi:SAM-dependent methyltransferase
MIYFTKYVSGKTLDYGAGTAKYCEIFKPYTTEYVAFDIVHGKNINIVGDVLNPPFANETFDTIVSTQVMEHVEKPWILVNQIKRILKPGGVCIMTAPFLIPYHADPNDFFRYTRQGLESLFKNEGFIVEECGKYGNAPLILAEMIHFAYFSHYKKRNKAKRWIRDKIMNLIKLFAKSVDDIFSNEALYANAYIVARKK